MPPDGQHLHVFVDEQGAHAAVAEDSTGFGELWWGKQLKGVRVSLPAAAPERVAELLEEPWRRRAPKRLAAAFDAARAG